MASSNSITGGSGSPPVLPQSPHFTLERVAEGVYAAVARAGGASMSNAGIVALGDTTLVFDTFLTPQAATDLRMAAERLTSRPVTLVVNSHWHDDHVFGNSVFAEAEILATGQTLHLMQERTAASIARYRAEAPAYVRTLEERREREADPAAQQALDNDIAFGRAILSALPTLEARLPAHTFDERKALAGSLRSAELLTYGGGHTASDALLYLPAERVLFAGDLVVNQNHPWIGHGDPVRWQAILDRLARLDIATLVPGHGPVGGPGDIAPVRQYLADVTALAEDLVARGETADDLAATPVPARYAALDGREVFARNMRFLYGYVTTGLGVRHE
jgi:glyoxylase-like metal-dependent hydrolase (beta-lactamase superfamily II)